MQSYTYQVELWRNRSLLCIVGKDKSEIFHRTCSVLHVCWPAVDNITLFFVLDFVFVLFFLDK